MTRELDLLKSIYFLKNNKSKEAKKYYQKLWLQIARK